MGIIDSKDINEIADNIVKKKRDSEEDESPIPSTDDTIPTRQTVALISDVFLLIDMFHSDPIFIQIGERIRQTDVIERTGRFNQATNRNNRMCSKNTAKTVTKKINIGKSNNQGRQLCGNSMRNHKSRSK